MTDPRLLKIEATRNEIKTLAADLHTLSYQELRDRIDIITSLSGTIFRLTYEIASEPYIEGTFTEIETFSKFIFEKEFLYVALDGVLYVVSKTGHIVPSAYLNSDPELSTVKHVCEFLESSEEYKDSMDTMKEVTGEDMVIGYSEEKYNGWGFSRNGHDYMFYNGSAIRRTTDN